jgi:hypothetical protein
LENTDRACLLADSRHPRASFQRARS